MILLRQAAVFRFLHRAILARAPYALSTTKMVEKRQVHMAIMRRVHPYTHVNVTTDLRLLVHPASTEKYPNRDALIAELHGSNNKNCPAELTVNVSDDERQVDVIVKKKVPESNFYCELALPVNSSLHIKSQDNVTVQYILGDWIEVDSLKDVDTKDVRSRHIKLSSECGDIVCTGWIMADDVTVQAKNEGNIVLDKPEGLALICKTANGNITVGCCYFDDSTFETDTGCMDLSNVHKRTKIFLNESGHLDMSGMFGTMAISANAGSMNLQLSRLNGESSIQISDPAHQAIINISDVIDKTVNIDASAEGIEMDETMCSRFSFLSEDNKNYVRATEPCNTDTLTICTKGVIKLGKLSWVQSIVAKKGLDLD